MIRSILQRIGDWLADAADPTEDRLAAQQIESRIIASLEYPARDVIRGALSDAIGPDAYDCYRVWEGWAVGSMCEDDFAPVQDRLDEITDAVVDAIRRHEGASI